MKKSLFLVLVFFVSIGLCAEDMDLKRKHIEKIYFFGDSPVLQGDHHIQKISTIENMESYSVYSNDEMISRYCEQGEKSFYNSVQLELGENSITFVNTNKIMSNYTTHTVKYDVTFEKIGNSVQCKVNVDREVSSLEEGDEIFDLIIQCVFDHGLALLPQFMECLELPDIPSKRECIWPLAETEEFMNVLQCILDGMGKQDVRGVYWRIFTKTQGMGFMSIKPFGSKEECSTTTGCTHFAIPGGYTVSIKATSAPGYKFEFWEFNGNLLSLDEEYSFIPSSGGNLIARFVKSE